MSAVKIGGVWKTPSTAFVKVGGVWKTVSTVSTKVGGSWKISTLGGAPAPELAYVSTGVFEVTNSDLTGVYTTTLVSGSGTVTQSTVGGKRRFTISGDTARFAVTFSYAVGSPQSAPDYMERKKYSYSCRTVSQTCYQSCNCRLEGGNCYCAPGPCAANCPPNGQCGCTGATPCQCGSIGTVVCDSCPYDCSYQDCDVLINEPGYTNSGTEWYKVA